MRVMAEALLGPEQRRAHPNTGCGSSAAVYETGISPARHLWREVMSTKSASNKTKHLVVLGVADDRKARAARFALTDEAAVRKMAGLMNFRVGIPKTEQAVALASKLPEGKIFDKSGLVPLVAEKLFYKLFESLSFDTEWTSAGIISGRENAADPDLVKAADAVWSAIRVGSIVLAWESPDPTLFGWSAAVVTAVSKDGATLDLRWRDWPEKAFRSKKSAVGLLCP
jgi:hypothetical protein